MLITIHCAKCSSQYKVEQKLAGKRVKCQKCGTPIAVAAEDEPASGDPALPREPDIFGLVEDQEQDNDLESLAVTASRPVGPKGPTQVCPGCQARVAKGSVICLSCGRNFKTGRGGHAAEIPLAGEAEAPVLKKRPSRTGSELLNRIDGYLAIAAFLLVAGGLIAWIMHVIQGAAAFSIYLILPTAAALALLAGVVAPLMMLGIQGAAHLLKFQPRPDAYQRLLMVVTLPFGMALLCGGHVAANPGLADTISGAWFIAPFLFLFLFRDELVALGATIGAALVSLLVAWMIVAFIGSLIPLVTGPLYADAMPPGPWKSLATGHSPAPVAVAPPEKKTEPVAIAPAPVVPDATVVPTPGKLIDPPPAMPPETVKPIPTVAVPIPAVTPAVPGPAEPAPPRVASIGKPVVVPPPAVVVPKPLHSPFLTALQPDVPELQGVREIITSGSQWFLSVKNADTGNVSVERWTTEPQLKKKGELSYRELPRQPNSYALSSNGSYLVALTRFPKWQLEIATFDNRPARRFPITDNLPPAEANAIPSLLGFLDPSHFMLRWDVNNRSVYQVFNCPAGDVARRIIAEPNDNGSDPWVLSPDGHWLAVLTKMAGTKREILLYDTLGAVPAKRINPMNVEFVCKGMEFSPDSKLIAVYASTKDAMTVAAFSAAKGESVYTAILPSPPTGDPLAVGRAGRRVADKAPGGEADAHELLWLRDSWLLDGRDIYEVEQGRKVGSLDIPGVIDQHLTAGKLFLLTQPAGAEEPHYVMGKVDENAIHSAIETLGKGQ